MPLPCLLSPMKQPHALHSVWAEDAVSAGTRSAERGCSPWHFAPHCPPACSKHIGAKRAGSMGQVRAARCGVRGGMRGASIVRLARNFTLSLCGAACPALRRALAQADGGAAPLLHLPSPCCARHSQAHACHSCSNATHNQQLHPHKVQVGQHQGIPGQLAQRLPTLGGAAARGQAQVPHAAGR